MSERIYQDLLDRLKKAGISGELKVEDRPLTVGEWFKWKVLKHGGDPRVSFKSDKIKIYMIDFSESDEWKMVQHEYPEESQ